MRTWEEDKRRWEKERLEDPESAAYFANAQAESAQELLGVGAYESLTQGSMEMSKTEHSDWGET